MAALYELSKAGEIEPDIVAKAIETYEIDPEVRGWAEFHEG